MDVRRPCLQRKGLIGRTWPRHWPICALATHSLCGSDRLGRSMSHLIEKVGELAARGVGFRSLTEQIDTTTSGGLLVFNIFGSLAEFERDAIRERTNAGSKAARLDRRQIKGAWTA